MQKGSINKNSDVSNMLIRVYNPVYEPAAILYVLERHVQIWNSFRELRWCKLCGTNAEET